MDGVLTATIRPRNVDGSFPAVRNPSFASHVSRNRAMSGKRLYLYDTTLRDGAQTQGVDFSVADKTAIARELDRIGIDYVEGGWPGANPTDDAFYAAPPKLARASFTALDRKSTRLNSSH